MTNVQAQEELVKRLCTAISLLKNAEESKALLKDILSPKEIEAAAQRLEVARLLKSGASYVDVSAETGASSTTVSRVSKCLNGEAGGYRIVLERLEQTSE